MILVEVGLLKSTKVIPDSRRWQFQLTIYADETERGDGIRGGISALQWLLILWMTSPLRYPSPIHNSVERASEVVREGGYEIREVLNLLSLVLDLDRSLDIILVWNAFFYLSFFTSFHDHQSLRPLCNSSLPPEHQCVSHLWLWHIGLRSRTSHIPRAI